MRYSIGQGYADSVPVSLLVSSATQRVFAATASSPAEFLCSWRKFLSLNDLPPLACSLLSFSDSLPLFSSDCGLFLQNAGWGIPNASTGCRGGVGIPIRSLDSRRESTKTPGAGDTCAGCRGWCIPIPPLDSRREARDTETRRPQNQNLAP